MGDYFAHWLKVGTMSDAARLPRLYYVNWFRQDAQGKFLWPGYGENSRVLKWVFERVSGGGRGRGHAHRAAPCGRRARCGRPRHRTGTASDELLSVDVDGWTAELPLMKEHYDEVR